MAPLHRRVGGDWPKPGTSRSQKDKAVRKSHRFLIIVAVSTPIISLMASECSAF